MIKILDIKYSKSELEQVAANSTQLNYEDTTRLLGILNYFGDLFDGTLGDWYAEPVDLDLKPDYKPFNYKYYLVPKICKEIFCKELTHLMKIGVLTPVQQSKYVTPAFLSPIKKVL